MRRFKLFRQKARAENNRRIAEMIKPLLDTGVISPAAFIAPMLSDQQRVRKIFDRGRFFEIYVRAPPLKPASNLI